MTLVVDLCLADNFFFLLATADTCVYDTLYFNTISLLHSVYFECLTVRQTTKHFAAHSFLFYRYLIIRAERLSHFGRKTVLSSFCDKPNLAVPEQFELITSLSVNCLVHGLVLDSSSLKWITLRGKNYKMLCFTKLVASFCQIVQWLCMQCLFAVPGATNKFYLQSDWVFWSNRFCTLAQISRSEIGSLLYDVWPSYSFFLIPKAVDETIVTKR